ncbi:MAG: 4-hydroxythreonine-4-phosphate dehydrogenase PdxA [Rhodospirillales bacterium]|nr:4-hydroxythreonine-4-phosphate dehydrogenase PdxA [Rhodospirillales bacterium]
MISHRARVAVTMGDPAGIGPEILLKSLARPEIFEFCVPVVYGNVAALERSMKLAGANLKVRAIDDPAGARGETGVVDVIEPEPLDFSAFGVGEGNAATGAFSAGCFGAAIKDGLKAKTDAVIMGPASKQAQNEGGYKFAGFRETANHFTGVDDTVLITLGDTYNLARVTTHVPLSEVPGLCSRENVLAVIRQSDAGMRSIGYAKPRIGVSALNPHCGEGGLLGREEIEAIGPAIEDARADGIEASGPYPGDTVFLNMKAGEFDLIISMFHDHGNACIKLAEFGTLVNLLAGAPIPILTVHHGTAFNIAGRGTADETNLVCAFYTAAGRQAPH